MFLPLVALVAVAGCGGPSPREELERTAARAGRIDAGTIAFSFVVRPRRGGGGAPFGFRLRGSFAFGDVPAVDVVYTQVAQGRSRRARLVLGAGGGRHVVGGRSTALTPRELRRERATANAAHSVGNLIDVTHWVDSAHRCGDRCVAGELDPGAAVSAFLEYGAGGIGLAPAAHRRLARATTATYRVTWVDDHLVRTLRVDATIGAGGSQQLRRDLGEYAGARVAVRLTVARHG